MTRRLPAAVWLSAAAFSAGCGYVGEPMPPLLNIPDRVTGLTARQIGGRIHVEFAIPALTTEGEVLKDLKRIDLRAGPSPAGEFSTDAWAATAERIENVTAKDRAVSVAVPVQPWEGKEIVVGVDLIAANGRHSGWSNLASVAVLPAPPVPLEVKAAGVREGVRLTWRADAPAFRIFRQAPGEKELARAGESAAPQWTDTATEYGKTYRYAVRSVVNTATGEAVSELSAETEITPEDRFAPAAPAGLTGVPSTASIELAWEASPEAVAYRIYRADSGGALAMVAEVAGAMSYSDRAIEARKTYRYAVTALDSAGNESEPSPPVEVASF